MVFASCSVNSLQMSPMRPKGTGFVPKIGADSFLMIFSFSVIINKLLKVFSGDNSSITK